MTTKEKLAELGFTDKEIQVIEQLANKQELSPCQLLRQALRQYQLVHEGLARLEFKDQPVGCPALD